MVIVKVKQTAEFRSSTKIWLRPAWLSKGSYFYFNVSL